MEEIRTPGSKILIAKQYDFLLKQTSKIDNAVLRKGTLDVLHDERFKTCTAACKKHQAYPGGLVVHTAEVLEVSQLMAKAKSLEVNNDILVAAVVWHDYGKVYDYAVKEVSATFQIEDQPPAIVGYKITYTKHQSLIRHLSRSYAMFISEFDGKLDAALLDQIGHCILSHHGRQEWGSPVEPNMTEAYILHFADMMSAFCSKKDY